MQPNISLAAEVPADTPIEDGPENARPGLIAPLKRGRSSRFIGEIVIDLGYADRDAVDAAIVEARANGRNTGSVLVERGVLSPYQLARVIAERFGVDFVDLGEFTVDHAAASLITPETARRYECVPIAYADERTLLLATPDPANVLAIDDIAMMTALDVRAVVASREELGALIARLGRLGDVMDAGEEEVLGAVEIHEEADDAPIVKLVHSIIAEAVELGASDVHFAPVAGELSVQYRIDGVLAASQGIPARMARGVVSRLKIMANLDIAERRQPAGRPHDARDRRPHGRRPRRRRCRSSAASPSCSASSTTTAAMIELDKLGIGAGRRPASDAGARRRPTASILVTGPTGSGKTTTLYSALQPANTGDAQDHHDRGPGRVPLDGINQMQVNRQARREFASAPARDAPRRIRT